MSRGWALAAGAAAVAAGVAAVRRARGRGPDRFHYRPPTELAGAWDDDEGYRGAAALVAPDGTELPVRIHLGGHIEPLDGSYRWYGRITRDEAVTALHGSGTRDVVVRVPGGADTPGKLTEIDPHGNARVTGTGRPPHPLDDPLAEEDDLSEVR